MGSICILGAKTERLHWQRSVVKVVLLCKCIREGAKPELGRKRKVSNGLGEGGIGL